MDRVEGKVAVVTGAASGIGRGMAQAFAGAGMKVVLSDVEEAALTETTEGMRRAGHEVHGVIADVSKVEAVEALAKESIARYGKVHVLCNNAGIGAGRGPVWEVSLDDWEWVLDVNLRGVIYGLRSFVPHMLEHGEPAHVVNTASLAGLLAGASDGPYAVTKFGVVALSEILYMQLQQAGGRMSASVLCPGFVNTNILDSERNRPADRGERRPFDVPDEPVAKIVAEWFQEQLREGLDPRAVGEMVLQAIKDDRFYILTHPDWNPLIDQRMRGILDGQNPQSRPPPGFEKVMQRVMQLRREG